VCIGNHFALMEGHVVLASLLKRLRFDVLTDAPVELEPLVTLRPKGGVKMRVTVREASA
jgi:cytochrome P450